MKKSAIILGATGLVGGILTHKLLEDDRYKSVISIHRRTTDIQHPKFEEIIGTIEEVKTSISADVLYCCIGTTQSKTKDKEHYKAIDYGIPIQAAQYCKKHGISTLIIISALGANEDSSIFYNRIKGEMERDVINIGVQETYFLQPSLIGGTREEKRTFEYLAKQLMKVINPLLIGKLKKYRSIQPETIAEAMLILEEKGHHTATIPSDQIIQIAHG